MASVLTHNLSNIDKITFFMEECRRMGIQVLGPDVNESKYDFAVNDKGEIRFGLGAVKGVGENAVTAIIDERKNGGYHDFFDLTRRVSSKAANKKCLESLVMAGALDCFNGVHRAQYFAGDAKDPANAIERAIRFANACQMAASSMQNSLFGDDHEDTLVTPSFAVCEPWNSIERLKREKEVVGFYISGHPLDEYRFEIGQFCNTTVDQLNDLESIKNREISMAGILTEVNHRFSKTGKPFGTFTLEDYTGSYRVSVFGEEYAKIKDVLVQEAFIFMRAKVQGRFYDPTQLELRPTLLTYLSDLTDKLARTFTVKLSPSSITPELIDRMLDSFQQSPGNCPVRIGLFDPVGNVSVELPSKKIKVKIHRKLVEDLTALGIQEMKVN